MAQLEQKTNEIKLAFQRYSKGTDYLGINKYSLEELIFADEQLGGRDCHKPYRRTLQNRIRKLQSSAKEKGTNKRHYIVATISIIAIIVAIVLWYLDK